MKLRAEDKSVWLYLHPPLPTLPSWVAFVFSLVLGAYSKINQLIKLGLRVAELQHSHFIGVKDGHSTLLQTVHTATLSVRTARCFLCAVPDFCFYFIFFLCHK